MSRRDEVEALLAQARTDREALLARVSPELAASLPVDATGITQGIEARAAVRALLDDAPDDLAGVYAAQERALLLLAARLDEVH